MVKSSFPVYVIQACMVSRDIGSLILDLYTVWSCVVRFSKGMYSRHALSSWLAGWARTGLFGDEKNLLFLLGIEPRIFQHIARSLYCVIPYLLPSCVTGIKLWFQCPGFLSTCADTNLSAVMVTITKM